MRKQRLIGLIIALGTLLWLAGRVTSTPIVTADAAVPAAIAGGSLTQGPDDPASQLPIETYAGDSSERSALTTLKRLGVSIYPEDVIKVFPDPMLELGYTIKIIRATPVIVNDGNRSTGYRSFVTTVSALLGEKKIEIGADDKVNPDQLSQLTPNLTITITRVQITQIAEKEAIDYAVTSQNDPTLDQGKTKISRAGVKGTRTKTYRVRRENGSEVSRVLLDNQVTRSPVDEILIVGTKPVITTSCRYNDTVLDAATKYSLDANDLCFRMMAESHGNPNIDGVYKGLFQYDPGTWANLSSAAGFADADWRDPVAQIYVTAWAWAHGQRGRWPIP